MSTRGRAQQTISLIRTVAERFYAVEFADEIPLSERVLYPAMGAESTPPVAPAAPAPAPAPVAGAGREVVLQVASFSARANAERAVARLQAAGIEGAQVLDAFAGGRPAWRVRIGPLAEGDAAGLVARIAGLGFGEPQVLRDR